MVTAHREKLSAGAAVARPKPRTPDRGGLDAGGDFMIA